MAILGFLTILVFLAFIISKKMSVITALVIIPLIAGIIGGISLPALGNMMLDGIKQVAPTGIMLTFAVLYFATMLDVGLFDPVVDWIIRQVKGDPLKVMLGTALLTMPIPSLDDRQHPGPTDFPHSDYDSTYLPDLESLSHTG